MQENHGKSNFSTKKVAEIFADSKKSPTFALALRHKQSRKHNGALVQLVRISACHAGGHGFESRTHRKKKPQGFFFFCIYSPRDPGSGFFASKAASRLRVPYAPQTSSKEIWDSFLFVFLDKGFVIYYFCSSTFLLRNHIYQFLSETYHKVKL